MSTRDVSFLGVILVGERQGSKQVQFPRQCWAVVLTGTCIGRCARPERLWTAIQMLVMGAM